MNCLYSQTLINSHAFNKDVAAAAADSTKKKIKSKPIYKLLSDNQNLISFNDNNNNNNNIGSDELISTSFFGQSAFSTGKLFFPNVEYLRNDVHAFTSRVFSKSFHLNGSMVIQRSRLKYQHFCLDFDLKKKPLSRPPRRMSLGDFASYCAKRNGDENASLERNFVYGGDNDAASRDLLNVNYIVYEIFSLLRHLGVKDDIYVLGKRGGCFEKGFHVEIPSFIMNYHDLAIFYEIVHGVIKNPEFFDATLNYSAFGSTKSDEDGVYLPYVCLTKENEMVCEKAMFPDSKSAFDHFNIFKPVQRGEKTLRYLDVVFQNATSPDKEAVAEMLKNLEETRFDEGEEKKRNDTTIPGPNGQRGATIDELKLIRDVILRDQRRGDTIPFCKKHKKSRKVLHFGDLIVSGKIKYKIFKIFSPELLSSRVASCDEVRDVYQLFSSSRCYACDPPKRKFSLDDQRRYDVSIKNVLKMYPNSLDKSFIFGKVNGTIVVSAESENNNDNDDDDADEKKNVIFHPNDDIFSDRHILDLYALKDFESTIHFLVAGYFTRLTTTESMIDWLWHLGKKATAFEKKDIALLNFLQIYNHVRCNSKRISLSIEWILVCLKHLIVTKNIIRIEEALCVARRMEKGTENRSRWDRVHVATLTNFAQRRIFTVRGATRDVVIPDIITAAILFCSNEAVIYELLALYRPIILTGNQTTTSAGDETSNDNDGKAKNSNRGKRSSSSSSSISTADDKIVIWDGSKWKKYQRNNSNVMLPFHLPEFYYVANIHSQITAFRRELKKENAKKTDNDDKDNNNNVVDDETLDLLIDEIIRRWYRKDSTLPDRLHCLNVNNNNGVNQMLHKIAAYWAKTEIFSVPSLFVTILLPEKYVLAGLSLARNDELVSIKPIPMYFQEAVDDNGDKIYDNTTIDAVTHHIKSCPFLNDQFFPLVRKLLRKKKGGRRHCPKTHDSFQTKRDLHLHLTERQCQRKETMSLIKLTKYFTLKQVANSYGDMMDVYNLLPKKREKKLLYAMIERYQKSTVEERSNSLGERVNVLAECYESIGRHHAASAGLPRDIPAGDMTVVDCDCPVTRVCVSLLQTFSYDVESLLYFLRLILRATCSNSEEFVNKIVHVFLGETNSGKTTLLQTILSVVGNQAGILSPHTVNHSSTLDRYHDLAKSYSFAKFWYMDEIANKPFNRQLINQITGNSRLFIRANYEAGNNVKIASTILIFGNNKPTFSEQCFALINRLRYMSFRSRFDSHSPVNFKFCQFPKLKIHDRYQRQLEIGMKALFLHAVCHSSHPSSPFYLYDNLFFGDMKLTPNIAISTKMYSPINDIVDSIFLICNLVEDADCALSQKRLSHLLDGLDALHRLNISSISDAITFVSQRYPLTIIQNTLLPDNNEGDTSVFRGIREVNVLDNDDRITYAKKRKMDEDGYGKRAKRLNL